MSNTHNRLQSLAFLIELEKRIRDCNDKSSLSFLLVNETHSLTSYRQGILWQPDNKLNDQVVAVSGLSLPDPTAPYTTWVRGLAKQVYDSLENLTAVQRISPELIDEKTRREWRVWWPSNAIWVPITAPGRKINAALILCKDEEWSEGEIALLSYLSNAASHAWLALENSKTPRLGAKFSKLNSKKRWVISLLILVVSLIPVHQTTLAPAEIIPKNPTMIRAGMDGVIDTMEVEPNQAIATGQTLVRLDPSQVNNQLEIARKALDVADAEYRQAAQTGVFDNRANANLAILKGRAEQHVAEVNYLESLQDRVTIVAPHAGIAVYTDPSDWEGRPVSIGERIMLLADPQMTEIEIQLPVADMIELTEGARVRLFLNTDPHRPIEAKVRFANYQASLTPENTLAYRVVAEFNTDNQHRIGLKGTAKLYGDRTVLFMYLMRRPLTSLRQMTGF